MLAYVLCLLGPVAYKVLGHAAYSWWLALVAAWFPAAFAFVVVVLQLGASLLRKNRRAL